MANQPVKFRKGVSTSLPKTPTNETIGAFLLETDTGNLYVDNSSTNRIQIKDNTKLPLSGGTLTGPINFNIDSLPQKTLQYVTGIDGFAEGGQLGWQSKENFLSDYSKTDHTHLYAGSTTVGGAANSATKLSTGRKISLGNAVTSTATAFDGSSDITIPINSVGEAFLGWGGKNISGNFGPLDAALVPTLGANRMAFSNPEGITIEYSRDAGATWTDYEASGDNKKALFTEIPYTFGFYIGKSTPGDNCATKDCLLRIIYDTHKAGLYTFLQKFLIYVSTNGNKDCWVTIETATNANPNTWETRANKQPISGWSGWNVINTGFTTYGNASTQWQFIKFTFGCDTTGTESKTYGGLNIQKIYGYGGFGWITPSNLAKQGRMYSISINQTVAFPNYVATDTPDGENPTVSQFLVTNGTDNCFRKASLAHVKKSLGIDIQSLINTLGEGTSNPIDDNYYIAQVASGTNQYVLKKHSSLYNYIKSKTDTVYAPKKHNHDEYIELSPNGTNNLIGTDNKINSVYLPTINIPTTLPNPQTLTIQINSQTVEGTSLFAYDGSEAESINIKSGEYITVTPDGDGNITIEGNYESATSVKLGLVKLSNELGDSIDTTVTQHLVSSKVEELDTKIEALDTKIDGYTQVIDNNKISFNQGDTTVASIHDNKIESENVIIHNSINIGDEDSGIFEILVDSTNGLIIR